MAEELKWFLKLFDDVSGPANSAANSLHKLRDEFAGNEKVMGGFEKDLKRTREEIAKLKLNPGQFRELHVARNELAKLRADVLKSGGIKGILGGVATGGTSGGLSALVGGVGAGGIMMGANALVSAGQTFFDLMVGAGKVVTGFAEKTIKASAEAETIAVAYESVLGKKDAALMLADIEEMSGKTKFDDDELKQAIRPLLLTGMKPGKEMADALAAAVDAEVVTGGGIGAVQGTLDTIKKLRAKDGASEKQIEAFGIPFKAFAQNLGMSVADAKQRVGAGDLGADRILKAVYKTIADMQGGKLGMGARKGADTVAGKLAMIEKLPGNFLKKMAKSEGFADLSDSLSEILKGLDPDSENGKRIIASLTVVFNDLMKWVKELTTPGRIESLAKGIGDAVTFAGELLRTVREVLGYFVKIGEIASSAGRLLNIGGDGGTQTPQDILDGYRKGMIGSEEFIKLGKRAGYQLEDGTRDAVEANSPSKVFEDIGRDVSDGFALGVDTDAMENAARIPSPSIGGVGGGLGARSLAVDVGGIHVSGSGLNAEEVAAAVDERLTASLLPKLAAALDTMATEDGVQDG